jgi:hypothetical protein
VVLVGLSVVNISPVLVQSLSLLVPVALELM